MFNASKARPLVRLGYMNYGVVGEENTFAKKFTERGGKFIYCLNIDEVKQTFNSIISELKSDVTELFCLEKNLSLFDFL